jgi:hypothetical protein
MPSLWPRLVVVPHLRLNLGPAQQLQQLQALLHGVIWLRLEDLGQQAELNPLLALLTLPVRSDADLQATAARIQALLDVRGPADLTAWAHDHANGS